MLKSTIKAGWNTLRVAAPVFVALLLIAFLVLALRQQRLQAVKAAAPPAQAAATNFFFVRGQLILIGPREGIDAAVEVLSTQDIQLELLRQVDLSRLMALVDLERPRPRFFPFTPQERVQGEIVMRLYQTNDASVITAVSLVNEQFRDRHVFADPNYLIGVLGQSQCGSPHSPGGSPHSPGGSPFETSSQAPGDDQPQGSNSSTGSGSLPQASAEDFWRQWAFEHVGISPPLADIYGSVAEMPTGQRVLVGVFDTSPFSITVTTPGAGSAGVQEQHSVRWYTQSLVTDTLSLTVTYPSSPTINSLEPITPSQAITMADHGLFVAGLVHAVAVDSEIELIRVLNDYGCGDLETLNEALIEFLLRTAPQRSSLSGVVMNMSLGIHKPRSVDKYERKQIADLMALQLEDLETLEKDQLESLLIVLAVANQEEVVVVAAAGNESTQAKALPMHVPADYPFVIGVAGSNVDRGRACFSNWGDVSAPGGEGGPDSGQPEDFPCQPQDAVCQGDCPEAVISLALDEPGSDPESTFYRYWSGTSFSTPMVSGLAALVLDGSSRDGTPATANQVFTAVRCGAPTPDGIISVPDTLSRCLP